MKSIIENKLCNVLEVLFMEQYCELFVYFLELFRVKYLYDEEEKMKIDFIELGFFNYLEFRYFINDLELKNEYIS